MTLLTSIVAHAAGLGKLTVFSTLGQPLNAEIDILAPQKGETITGKLAPPERYQEMKAQFNNALVGTRVTLEKRPNGQPYLKVSTPRPVNEPFLELLVEINSEHGRVMRQYTALLDPPGYGSAAAEIPPPAVASAPTTRAPATPAPAPPARARAARAPAAAPVAPRATRAAAPAARPAPSASERQYGPIKPGETLGRIARTVKPAGVSLEQALVGLYRENPDAFIKKNMNLVKSGKILRVPQAAELTAVPQTQAVQEVRMQVADFNAFRSRLADRAATAAESGTVTSGRIGTQVADGAGAGLRDTVRLSRGESAKGTSKGGTSDRVRELEEEIIAREKALAEANARIAQLEQIIKDSQRAVELKSSGMAAAQKGAEKSAQVAAAPEAPAPGKALDPGATTPELPVAGEADKGVPPTVSAETPPDAIQAPPPAQPEPPAIVQAPETPAPEPAPERDFVTTLMEEPLYLAAGGLALLGGLGLLVAARRRRSAASRSATDDGMVKISPSLGGGGGAAPKSAAPVAPGAAAQAAPASGRGAAPRSGARSGGADDNDLDFNVGMRRGAPPPAGAVPPQQPTSAAKAPEAAPPAPKPEARTPEAKPRTPEAPPVTPERARTAEPPRTAEPARTPEPPRATEPPRTAERASAPEPPRAQDHAARATETLRAAQAKARTPAREPLEPLMPDFALDSPSPSPAAPKSEPVPPARDPHLLDFDLDPLPPVSRPADMEKVSSEPPASMDFKLDLDDLDIRAPAAGAAAAPVRDDHWYDVQQKFDLAKAYEEMGDKSGARDILQEVLREGDAEQQSQAKKLLGTLS